MANLPEDCIFSIVNEKHTLLKALLNQGCVTSRGKKFLSGNAIMGGLIEKRQQTTGLHN
jgi:hypothetical protein